MPGGTKSIVPLCCTTRLVFIVPSKLSSALQVTSNATVGVLVSPLTCCRDKYPVSRRSYREHEWTGCLHTLLASIVNCNHSMSDYVEGKVFVANKTERFSYVHTSTSQPLMTRISFFSSYSRDNRSRRLCLPRNLTKSMICCRAKLMVTVRVAVSLKTGLSIGS